VLSTLFPCCGFARTALLQNAVIHRGLSFDEAETNVKRLAQQLSAEEVIMIESFTGQRSAVVLDEPPWKFRSRPTGSIQNAENQLGFKVKYFLTLQTSETPAEVPGFELIDNHFVSAPIFFEGYQLSWFTPGYGYAVYQKLPPP
jgi:hypothetical protein